jgi:hypothetical protein
MDNNNYYDFVPELGEKQYEAEQAMMDANILDIELQVEIDFSKMWFGDNSTAEENAAMERSENSHRFAQQAHLLGAW